MKMSVTIEKLSYKESNTRPIEVFRDNPEKNIFTSSSTDVVLEGIVISEEFEPSEMKEALLTIKEMVSSMAAMRSTEVAEKK